MINDKDTVYWIWLSQVLKQGSNYVEEVLSHFKTPRHLYEFGVKNNFNNINFLSDYIVNRMQNVTLDEAKDILEKCKKNNYEIINFNDENYPDRLKNIYSSPLLLYVDGNIENLDNILSIAVIGARKCSDYAKEVTRMFVSKMAKSGITIISGMAIGIDGIALNEAINNDARAVAVIGCGLDVDYPIQNRELKKAMKNRPDCCIISEYPPGTRPFAYNFPVRNRIMSGLSVGVLVVEAGDRSGSLITAKIAVEQGKDVYGVPNNIFFENNLGTLNLLKDGATLVTSPDDIINQYKWQYKLNDVKDDKKEVIGNINFVKTQVNAKTEKNVGRKKTKLQYDEKVEKLPQNSKEYNLEGVLKQIYDLLYEKGKQTVDDISEILNINISEVLVNITELELIGCIKSYPGMKYGVN